MVTAVIPVKVLRRNCAFFGQGRDAVGSRLMGGGSDFAKIRWRAEVLRQAQAAKDVAKKTPQRGHSGAV
jgi:hypothetical protein